MTKKGRLVLVIVIFLLPLMLPSMAFAVCSGIDTCSMLIWNPSGANIDSCQIVVSPVGGTNCNQPSNPSCTRVVNCGMRGTYKANMSPTCHVDMVLPREVDILTCSYDDCSNCCTAGTGYKWGLPGDYALPSCCGDDSNEYYQLADVGPQNLCCNSIDDCAINGLCISKGSTSGNNCCYGSSDADTNRPACASYSSGTTCYYSGASQCNAASGWDCSYSTRTCGSSNECTQTCGTETCIFAGGYDWAFLPSTETACGDGHDNDCDGSTDMADSDCWQCASGACCDTSTHLFRPNGYVCDNTDVCRDATTLCDYMTCDGAGSCNQYGGCSACAGKTTGQCGVATGNCIAQVGNDVCEFTDDVMRCANCDHECDAAFMCTPITVSRCCYSYSQCLAKVNDPQRQPGQEPSDTSQCLCHTLFQDVNCV